MKVAERWFGILDEGSAKDYPKAEVVSVDGGKSWRVSCREARGLKPCPALDWRDGGSGAVLVRRTEVTDLNCGPECRLARNI